MTAPKWLSTALVFGIVVAFIVLLSTGEPRLPAGSADGSYYNPCCGFMTLHNGELRSGKEAVSYVIEQDKGGAYVLPKALVSVASNRLDIDPTAYPIKLRIYRNHDPSIIEVLDRSDAPSHMFLRRNVR
jgi:hypothetical protein